MAFILFNVNDFSAKCKLDEDLLELDLQLKLLAGERHFMDKGEEDMDSYIKNTPMVC